MRRGSAEIFAIRKHTVNTAMHPSPHTYIQYCVYTSHPDFKQVFEYISTNNILYEVHLNRTRFWIERKSKTHTEFLLKHYHRVSEVKE